MRKVECLVIGGGPAGLAAGIEAASRGAEVLVVDENLLPGGQLFKQIHKFFGSQEHQAGTRGYRIGQQLLQEAEKAGVEVRLNTRCWGIFDDGIVGLVQNEKTEKLQAKQIVFATGASENALSFPGCTLPGVMTAGAAQTFLHVQRVLPGKRVLMVGTGNVGLIVSYQLLQAGADVVGIVEAAPAVGGYDVHAGKLRRAGVPFYLGHTVAEALGTNGVAGAVVAPVSPADGTRENTVITCDTICLAVGLTPRIELPCMAGVPTVYEGTLGGHLPLHDDNLVAGQGYLVAGDAAGVEEASTAMEEGRLAGLSAAFALGKLTAQEAESARATIRQRLEKLRSGHFGAKRAAAKAHIFTRGLQDAKI